MAELDLEKLIPFKRYPSYASLLPLLLYMPIGLAIGLIRLGIFLHLCLLSYLLPDSFPLKRWVLRTMLSITGLAISTQGIVQTDNKKKILIANHVTNLDPFILALLYPNILTLDNVGMTTLKQKPSKRFELPTNKDHQDILLSLRNKVRESEEPLLFFPEKVKTDGKISLLKFSQLPFEVECPIQPVTFQVSRYFFDVNVSTFSSTAYEDLFWCLVLPMTLFKIKYLPVTEKKKEESKEEFASRVQSNMAKSMGVGLSLNNHHDVLEYVKRKAVSDRDVIGPTVKHKVNTESGAKTQVNQTPDQPAREDPELEKMVIQVKDVLSDTPRSCILADLRKTRDVDITITNILEGRVEVPKSSSNPGASPNSPSIVPASALSFKASKFETNPGARQMSFAERKQAMLEAARIKYRQKHGL